MAAASLANFLSFFNPSKPPPPPSKIPTATHVSTAASPPSSSGSPGLAPLILSNESQLSISRPADVISVVCPSLAYANTMFFDSSSYNVEVLVGDEEPEEQLVGRFKREVMKAGIIQEFRRRRFHESTQDKRKRKVRDAAKRNRFRRSFRGNEFADRSEDVRNGKEDSDDEDNWDLPEGDLPG